MKRIILWGAAGLFILFILLQLIPINTNNPAVTREIKWNAPETRALAQRACFDCHSNETVWPWYSKIAPIKFMLADHVNEGRGRLNFSQWDQPNADYDEIEESVREGAMPLQSYLMIHSNAKLTDAEKEQLLTGLQATFQQDPPIEGERGRGGGDD